MGKKKERSKRRGREITLKNKTIKMNPRLLSSTRIMSEKQQNVLQVILFIQC